MEIKQEKRDPEDQDPEHNSPKRQRIFTSGDLAMEDRSPLKESMESRKAIGEQDDSTSDSSTGSSSSGSSSGSDSSDSDDDDDDFAEILDNELHLSTQAEQNQSTMEEEETIVEEIVADEIPSQEIPRDAEENVTDSTTSKEPLPEVVADETTNKEALSVVHNSNLVDKSIRGPSSGGFFFSREAYEAYSVDSIENIVNRHVQWIQQHNPETELAYKRYFQPSEPDESSKSTPTNQTPSPAANRAPVPRNKTSPASSSSPVPSSPVSGVSNHPDVLDSLLSTIHHEAKPKRQNVPTDIAIAAVSLAQPVQDESIILGDYVKDIYQSLCDLERKRIQQYPRYYAHHSHLKPPVFGKVQALKHSKNITARGKIAYCSTDGPFPEKLDMRKNFIQADTNTEDYYCQKVPLTLNQDSAIAPVVKNEKPHIVTTLDTLIKIVEIPNDLSVAIEIPIIVKEDEEGNKTVYLDPPLLNNDASVHDQNQAVYDLVFKSHRLEWNTRQTESSEKSSGDSESTYEDEHLRYVLWGFGDMSVLTRHQVDGLLKNINNANSQAYLRTNIIYPNSHVDDTRVGNLARARYWIQSYLTGHGKILEGRVDVNSNQVIGTALLHMRDIMKNNWTPSKESEFIRQLFQELHRTLKPGSYLLYKTSTSQQTAILQSVAQEGSEYDLYNAHDMP